MRACIRAMKLLLTNGKRMKLQDLSSRKLNLAGHIWLTALSAGMGKQQLKQLLEKIESFDSKLDRKLADSVLEITVNANWQVVEELRGDEHMYQALLEIINFPVYPDQIQTLHPQ